MSTVQVVCPECLTVNRVPADRLGEDPVFAATARELRTQARFAKVDTEAAPALARRFDIRAIPTLVLFHGAREVKRAAGAMDGRSLARWIREAERTA